MGPFLKKISDIIPGLGALTFDPNPGTIFITSGTGVLGYRVAKGLRDAGHPDVRCGFWKGGGMREKNATEVLKTKGCDVVEFDWEDRDHFAVALQGIKTVFVTLPYISEGVGNFPAFLKACKRAKVEHVIKISFAHAQETDGPYRKVPLVSAHGDCDDILEQVPYNYNMSYTIIAATHLMSNPLVFWADTIRDEQKFYGASGGMGVSYISPNDVAEVACLALLDRKTFKNKQLTLTGGAAVKDEDVAILLSKFTGKTITFENQGLHDFERTMIQKGKPRWMAKDLASLEKIKASGLEEETRSFTDTFEKLTGKKPESYQNYFGNPNVMTYVLEDKDVDLTKMSS
eukprot:CAMPEP_0198279800 /NCGR_PEP_ID=MMETSP1449-20131203/21_1 /TAXON_ID=420275 /ORGANISM="Attheya septentrionalis, Strain CCMP2084" /LENGTH=343 /DNA_ID=CAMNT_0043975017 /DNA_START=84 /DNA_END=1115 /DNA_ORIENTATION=+